MTDGLDWIFFDLGSTLIDESAAAELRIREAAKRSGVPYDECFAKTAEYFAHGKNGYAELAKELHIQLPHWHSEAERLYPDTEDCLRRLSARYKIGIIANQNAGVRGRLAQFGILRYFDVVASSAEAGAAKPDRRLFDIALKQAACVPERAMMIGDRLDNDITPAKALGMKTLWLKRGFCARAVPRTESETPDFIAENLTEVTERLL